MGPREGELTETCLPGLGEPSESISESINALGHGPVELETFMRNAIVALLTVGGLAAIGTAPARAVGTRYPFCITAPSSRA